MKLRGRRGFLNVEHDGYLLVGFTLKYIQIEYSAIAWREFTDHPVKHFDRYSGKRRLFIGLFLHVIGNGHNLSPILSFYEHYGLVDYDTRKPCLKRARTTILERTGGGENFQETIVKYVFHVIGVRQIAGAYAGKVSGICTIQGLESLRTAIAKQGYDCGFLIYAAVCQCSDNGLDSERSDCSHEENRA